MPDQKLEESETTDPPPRWLRLVQNHPYLLLFVVSLLIRFLAGFALSQPGYVDAYYYYQVAENWRNGEGFVEKTLWNYQLTSFRPLTPPLNLTHTALDYWNPLTAWLTAISFSLFGISFWVAQIPFILCSAALPPLAFYVGKLTFGDTQQRYSWIMAMACLFAGRYFIYWNTTDNFAPFALIGILALICMQRGLYQNDFWLIPAGVLSGLAYLSRNDGILIYVTLVISFLWVKFRGNSLIRFNMPRWGLLFASAAAALLTVSPWLIRNLAELGTLISSNSSKVLFLRGYEEIFSYNTTLDLNHYLGWGFTNILGTKTNALWINFLLICTQGLFALAPLFIIGIFLLIKKPLLLPFFTYTIVLYLTMSLVFTEISVRGTLFHSAGVLLPYQAGAFVLGCERCASWLIKRNKALAYQTRQARSIRIGTGIASVVLLISIGLTLFYSYNEARTWDEPLDYARKVHGWFVQNKLENNVIIVNEPVGYYYATKQPAIGQAQDGVAANLEAAKRYGAKYLVLSSSYYPAMKSLYEEKKAPPAAGLRLELFAEFDDYQIYRIVPDQ